MIGGEATANPVEEAPTSPGWIVWKRVVVLWFCVMLATHWRAWGLAIVGVLVSWGWWAGLDRLVPGPIVSSVPAQRPFIEAPTWDLPAILGGAIADPIGRPVRVVVSSVRERAGVSRWFHDGMVVLGWAVLWGIVGCAIARMTIAKLLGGERLGIVGVGRFALGRTGSLILAPAIPLAGMLPLLVPCVVIGALGRLGAGGLVGWLVVVPIALGIFLALSALVLAAAWPLMVVSLGTEGEDGFDAVSRSLSYVIQNGMVYALLTILSWIFGVVGLGVLVGISRAGLVVAAWGMTIGGPDVVAERLDGWYGLLDGILMAWAFGFFWTVMSCVYMFLREDVDGMPATDPDASAPI